MKYQSSNIFGGLNINSELWLSWIMEIWNLELYSHLILHLAKVLRTHGILINHSLAYSPSTRHLNEYLTFQSCVLRWCMKKLHYTTAEKLAMNSFIIPWDDSNKQTIWAMHLHIYFLTKIIALKNVNHLSIQEPFNQYCVVNTKFSPNRFNGLGKVQSTSSFLSYSTWWLT